MGTTFVDIDGEAYDELQWQCFGGDRLWQITIACDSDILLPILRRDSGAADTRVSGKYFYHTDHLGSANWVTKDDEAVQFIHYMPYGEMWYNQRGSAYNERYKYTGKERDEETGNDYFGARYYAAYTPMWLSPDPLMDKYPGISPYAYCNWNPMKYVDPDGNFPIIPLYFAYYATAKVLENSNGSRDIRTTGYAMQHPINSLITGTADFPSWGYSKIASNFYVNLQNGAGFSKADGGQGNAYRHTLWQALLTNAMGDNQATRIGNAHENYIPKNMSLRIFANLEDADRIADILNNAIGRQIGKMNKGVNNSKLAELVLKEYMTNGLWEVTKDAQGQYIVEKNKLPREQYNAGLLIIKQKGNDGLNL